MALMIEEILGPTSRLYRTTVADLIQAEAWVRELASCPQHELLDLEVEDGHLTAAVSVLGELQILSTKKAL